jgi:acylpyruvate hydrolase
MVRLITHEVDGFPRPAVLTSGGIVALEAALARAGRSGVALRSVREVLAALDCDGLRRLGAAADDVAAGAEGKLPSIDDVVMLPPVTDPQKIICLALNSKKHCAEASIPEPTVPWYFPKWANGLLGHNGVIVPPPHSHKVDWEGEVAIVIGKPGRGIDPSDALEHVAGVMPFNDVSARDLIVELPAIQLSKALDTFAPCGPALVTLDEIDDVQSLRFKTYVNGELKQDGSTDDHIAGVAETVAFHSRNFTLMPGDIIAMGTTVGVGLFCDPPQFLQEGDVVEVTIEGVGTLRNSVGASSLEPHAGPTSGRPNAQSSTR